MLARRDAPIVPTKRVTFTWPLMPRDGKDAYVKGTWRICDSAGDLSFDSAIMRRSMATEASRFLSIFDISGDIAACPLRWFSRSPRALGRYPSFFPFLFSSFLLNDSRSMISTCMNDSSRDRFSSWKLPSCAKLRCARFLYFSSLCIHFLFPRAFLRRVLRAVINISSDTTLLCSIISDVPSNRKPIRWKTADLGNKEISSTIRKRRAELNPRQIGRPIKPQTNANSMPEEFNVRIRCGFSINIRNYMRV